MVTADKIGKAEKGPYKISDLEVDGGALIGGSILGTSNYSTHLVTALNGDGLATQADLQLLGGGINGSVVVDHISVMDAEIRRFNYDGHLPSPGALVVVAAPLIWAGYRRR